MAEDMKHLGKVIPIFSDAEEDDDDELSESSSVSSGSDDDESCSPNPERLDSTGPLCGLSSSLMQHLPIKKGLSNYYEGKSQSFTSLNDVRSVGDLPKKEIPVFKRKIKPSKSYAGGLGETQRNYPVQDPSSKIITAKSSTGSCANLVARGGNSTNFAPREPPIHVNKNLARKILQ